MARWRSWSPRRKTYAVGLVLPFLLWVPASHWAADRAADHASVSLVVAADDLRKEPEVEPVLLVGDLGIGDPAPIALPYYLPLPKPNAEEAVRGDPASPDGVEPAARPQPRSSPHRPQAPRGGISVSRGRVVSAAKAGVRPTGMYVPPRGARPGGMQLGGVSAAGTGLVDGDVLTEIAGAPATSEGAVVGAVTRALRLEAPVITGTIWRQGRPMSLAIELPKVRFDDDEAGRSKAPDGAGPDGVKPGAVGDE